VYMYTHTHTHTRREAPLSNKFKALKEVHNSKLYCEQTEDDVCSSHPK